MNIFKEGKTLAVNVIKDVTGHWKTPGGKNQVPYKEILNLGLGGMGQQFVTTLTGYFGLSVGNTLIGSTIGITPMHIQYMSMIYTVLNIFFAIIRSRIVDNTRTRWGRFRPYIAVMGIPISVLAAVYIFLPVPTLPYTQKLYLTFFVTVSIAMISPMFTDTYSELQTVISSNSEERSKIIAINSIIYSMAPTLTGLFVPMLAARFGGYTNINTYRYVIVPVAVLGVGMNLFTAFGCKERIVASKNYTPRVRVIEGCLQIYRNKHWWLRTVSGWIGFAESACGVIFSWIFIYGTQDMTNYGLLNTVLGTASGIAMFSAPFLLKRLGNRRLLLVHNGLNIVFVTAMLFTYKTMYLFFIFNYLNTFVNALSIVYNNVMHAEVKDYQQYISGKRMDFMFGTAGLIGLPVTLSTGLVIPYVYELMGVTTNYDILFDPTIRNNFFMVLCLMSIAGAITNLIPFFFYSLSVEKHRNIVKALEYRALFDDYADGCLSDERIVETMAGIEETYACLDAPAPDLAACKRAVRAASGKAERKAARKALKAARQLLVEKDAAVYLTDELTKFETPEMQMKLGFARPLAALQPEDLRTAPQSLLTDARALPASTKAEKRRRRYAVSQAKKRLRMAAAIQKAYPNGIEAPDESRLHAALAMPDDTREAYRARNRAIREAEKELELYHRTFKPYLDAKTLVREEAISRTLLPDMRARYRELTAAPKTAAAQA